MTAYEHVALEVLRNGKIPGRVLRKIVRWEVGLIRSWCFSAPRFYAMMSRLEDQGLVQHEDVWRTIVSMNGDHWEEHRIKERFYQLNPALEIENQ